jgi:hypothetical protein
VTEGNPHNADGIGMSIVDRLQHVKSRSVSGYDANGTGGVENVAGALAGDLVGEVPSWNAKDKFSCLRGWFLRGLELAGDVFSKFFYCQQYLFGTTGRQFLAVAGFFDESKDRDYYGVIDLFFRFSREKAIQEGPGFMLVGREETLIEPFRRRKGGLITEQNVKILKVRELGGR